MHSPVRRRSRRRGNSPADTANLGSPGCHRSRQLQPREKRARTNGFSKRLANHAAMVALYFMHHKFGLVHQTLRVTPAMEAGIADHVWSIEEIVGLRQRYRLAR